jgi:HSP20 family protein
MMLNNWNSLFDVTRAFNELDTLYEDRNLMTKQESGRCRRHETVFFKPAVDIRETDEALILECDMPGVSKENLDVTVDNDQLTVTGKIDKEPEGKAIYRETRIGDYRREFNLGDGIDRDAITAKMQAGQLTIRLAKLEAVKPRKIEVVTRN